MEYRLASLRLREPHTLSYDEVEELLLAYFRSDIRIRNSHKLELASDLLPYMSFDQVLRYRRSIAYCLMAYINRNGSNELSDEVKKIYM